MLIAKTMLGLFTTGLSLVVAAMPADEPKSEMGQRLKDQGKVMKAADPNEENEVPATSNAMPEPPSLKSDALQYSSTAGTEAGGSKESAPNKANPAFRGRLPRYYSAVVTPKQRAEIYSIQQRYRAQLATLEAPLAELR
ncbi:MAG: hypothetical protein AAGG44_12645, partial [Planctomycetota bacterium]